MNTIRVFSQNQHPFFQFSKKEGGTFPLLPDSCNPGYDAGKRKLWRQKWKAKFIKNLRRQKQK